VYQCDLLSALRILSYISKEYPPVDVPECLYGHEVDMAGFTHSKLTLAVHKETDTADFAYEQAVFMMHLGENVCPRIFALNNTSYVMEYLTPQWHNQRTLCIMEKVLTDHVWNRSLVDAPFTKQIGDESWRQELLSTIGVTVPDWALHDDICLIHGDATLDNTLTNRKGYIRIADPIPPHRLMRPSIRAIDHAKMLQSMLGWEVILRGVDYKPYLWPKFAQDYEVLKRAVFWCMVGLKRIALRDTTNTSAGKWAIRIAGELESCVQSF
jgi:hypothetical protein